MLPSQHILKIILQVRNKGNILYKWIVSRNPEFLKSRSLIDLEDARKQIAQCALYYITPKDFFKGKSKEILNSRQKKLDNALDNLKNYWEK